MRSEPPFWTRHLSRQLQFALDVLVLVGSFALAYVLRFDFAIPRREMTHGLIQLPVVVLIQFSALYWVGVYSFIWRYVGLAELHTFVRAAAYSTVPLLLLRLGLPDSYQPWKVPLSIIFIDTALAFGGTLSIRVLRRMLYESYERSGARNGHLRTRRTLLIGAGRSGVAVAKEAITRGDSGLDIVGFVDDDPLKHGTVVQGVRVLGPILDLPDLVPRLAVETVIIAMTTATRRQIRRLVNMCEQLKVEMKIVPGLWEIIDGSVTVNRLREVQIEDLLGRDAVQLDEAEVRRFLSGKRVMVTGAGGSIGSEIARQVCRFEPASLLLVERAEFALFNIDREIHGLLPELELIPIVGDVSDEACMRSAFSKYRPEVIFHAAAHKHVPLMESNCAEAFRNNVLGTKTLGELAAAFDVESFVLISTDKAVRPASVMGATKRLAELIIQDLDQRTPTRFVAVRFGNVMGSAGSVISIFREQIEHGGPVTVTHEDMVRYFMTIPEASQLVLQAGAIGRGGDILILDMGEPVRIMDLAKDMIRLSGLKPYEDIDIFITGRRPGEKLFEELEVQGEEFRPTSHPKIYGSVLAAPLDPEELHKALRELEQLGHLGMDGEIRRLLNGVVEEARLHLPEMTPPLTWRPN